MHCQKGDTIFAAGQTTPRRPPDVELSRHAFDWVFCDNLNADAMQRSCAV
jgi:hypothetical protein